MANVKKLLRQVIESGEGFNPNEVVDKEGNTVAKRENGDSLLKMLRQAAKRTKGGEAFLIQVGGGTYDATDDNIIL